VRPKADDALEGCAVRVEGDDIVIRLDEATCHGKAHVSQPDEPDLHGQP
jgi:hypothetical protein